MFDDEILPETLRDPYTDEDEDEDEDVGEDPYADVFQQAEEEEEAAAANEAAVVAAQSAFVVDTNVPDSLRFFPGFFTNARVAEDEKLEERLSEIEQITDNIPFNLVYRTSRDPLPMGE